LRTALEKLNPAFPPEAITAAIDELTRDRSAMLLEQANREVYRLLKESIPVSVVDTDISTPHGPLPGRGGEGGDSTPRPGSQSSASRPSPGLRPPSPVPTGEGHGRGGQTTVRVRVIDWEQPANNDFLLVSQFIVKGALYTCRPDLVGFVNPDCCRGWWSSS